MRLIDEFHPQAQLKKFQVTGICFGKREFPFKTSQVVISSLASSEKTLKILRGKLDSFIVLYIIRSFCFLRRRDSLSFDRRRLELVSKGEIVTNLACVRDFVTFLAFNNNNNNNNLYSATSLKMIKCTVHHR